MTDENEVANALQNIATQLKYLGNGDAATTMGAIEALGMQLEKSAEIIAAAIPPSDYIGDAISEGLHAIAEAIEGAGTGHKEVCKGIVRELINMRETIDEVRSSIEVK
jgi:hypothetical protein